MKTIKIGFWALAISALTLQACGNGKNEENGNADTTVVGGATGNTDEGTGNASSSGNSDNNMNGSTTNAADNAGQATGDAAVNEGMGSHKPDYPVDTMTNRKLRPDTSRTKSMDGL